MAIKAKTFSLLAFIFTIACLIALIIAFASDRWVVSTEQQVTGFKNIGLWSACFHRYRPPPYALVDKYYDGCWWVFDREIDELRFFLFPSWLVSTQVLVTLGLTFELLAIIAMTVNAINCFPYNRYKDTITLALSIVATVLHALTGILLTVAVILFGTKADNERTWLEKPDQNYLSWSFGMCVLAAFLSILAFMAMATEFYRYRLYSKEPKVLFTSSPPPPTSYAYSHKFQPVYPLDHPDRRGQPAYVGRHLDQQQSRAPPQPPNTMFAVSGAGELYVNRSYDDDNRQRGRLTGYTPQTSARYGRPPDSSDRFDRFDSRRDQTTPAKLENVTSMDSVDIADDYEAAKKAKHPVLPEYKTKSGHKVVLDSTLDESCDSELKEEKKLDYDSTDKLMDNKKSQSRSNSKNANQTKVDSSLPDKKSKTNASDLKGKNSAASKTKKYKKEKKESGDEDGQKRQSRSRSKKRSKSRERSTSRHHRSKSHDKNSSVSETYSDSSETEGKKHRSSSASKKHKRHHSASKESIKHGKSSRKNKATSSSEDSDYMSGTENKTRHKSHKKADSTLEKKKRSKSQDFSDTESVRSRQRSRNKSKLAVADKQRKAKSQDFSDSESVRSRSRSKKVNSNTDKKHKSRSQEFSDNESVRSRQSRHSNVKPKGTYSSYYE